MSFPGLNPELAKRVEEALRQLRTRSQQRTAAPAPLLREPPIEIASDIAKLVQQRRRLSERELKRAVDQIRKEAEKRARELAKKYGLQSIQL